IAAQFLDELRQFHAAPLAHIEQVLVDQQRRAGQFLQREEIAPQRFEVEAVVIESYAHMASGSGRASSLKPVLTIWRKLRTSAVRNTSCASGSPSTRQSR